MHEWLVLGRCVRIGPRAEIGCGGNPVLALVGIAGHDRSPQLPQALPRPTFSFTISGLSGGAARGIRTPDPVITNDVLYQLSYCGNGAVITGGGQISKQGLTGCCAPSPLAMRRAG